MHETQYGLLLSIANSRECFKKSPQRRLCASQLNNTALDLAASWDPDGNCSDEEAAAAAGRAGAGRGRGRVDDIIDHSIEIESNKRMRSENVNAWTLRFKRRDMETEFCHLKEDMFKSNMVCCFCLWLFVVAVQAVMVPWCVAMVATLCVATAALSAALVLVMAEEFPQLPLFLRVASADLVHHRRRRTALACATLLLMAGASSVALVRLPASSVSARPHAA
ncbi:LOW QUALITY PROTEIN: Uncharacterized protein GBIM_01137, partial [Gryllus bimaculatus]